MSGAKAAIFMIKSKMEIGDWRLVIGDWLGHPQSPVTNH